MNAEEATELSNVVTRDPKEVKIGDIKEPNEQRESCNDVAKNPIMDGVAAETEEVKDEYSEVPELQQVMVAEDPVLAAEDGKQVLAAEDGESPGCTR